jgi:hypothetical protein
MSQKISQFHRWEPDYTTSDDLIFQSQTKTLSQTQSLLPLQTLTEAVQSNRVEGEFVWQ